jgi:beta-glucosidase
MEISNFEDARAAVRAGAAPAEAAAALVNAMTEDERLWCLDGDTPTWAGLDFLQKGGYHRAPFRAGAIERIGMPGLAFADGPRGCVVGNGTAFPVSMARGATWDPELEERVGDVIGRELRAVGANLTGAVCVNLLRHPAWGRAQETYGEDPLHVGELGAALTRGLQHHVLACVKHYACNSMENARFSVDIDVEEVALHEIYLPHFKRIVDEGVASVMSAYNSVNGEWAGQNRSLLTEILREEWGFDGFVISDFIFGIRDAAASLAAGLDVEMPYRMVRAGHLRRALDHGTASWADVDSSVIRIISTLLAFDGVLSAPPSPRGVLGAPGHRALAREVAARSAVLLRNQAVDGVPVLPFARDSRVAVIGRLAASVNIGDGGSSDVWDLACRTVLDGVCETVGDVSYDDGTDRRQAAVLAASADIALVVVGHTSVDEGEYIGETDPSLGRLFPAADDPDLVAKFEAELADLPVTSAPEHLAHRPAGFSVGGDRTSLRLHDADVELVRAVGRANPRTVVAIQTGSAVVMSEWIDDVAAVVQCWYGGCEAGPGLSDVLLGRVNPSARLPFTVPFDESDLPPFDREARSFTYDRWHGWWHLRRTGTAAAFPFGFGLSYTTFELVDAAVTLDGSAIVVAGSVRNTGERDGADVVQVYATLPDPGAPERLVGFERVEIASGGTSPYRITVPTARLETRNPRSHVWRRPSGTHCITVARHAGDSRGLSQDLSL